MIAEHRKRIAAAMAAGDDLAAARARCDLVAELMRMKVPIWQIRDEMDRQEELRQCGQNR